jgi:TPR repeat protein
VYRYLVVLVTLFSLSLVSLAYAGFDEGQAAYDRGDYVTAYEEFKALAEQGHPKAQFNLGLMYYSGQGVPQNNAEALKWFHKAAEQEHAGAQYNLGLMYYSGQGVDQDYAEAVKWFRRAAEQGDATAQYDLGSSYFNGQGVPQDFVQAYMWFSLAASQGDSEAQKDRDSVAQKMTPSQVAKAQRLARTWKPKGK